ncbi:MAG: TonB family protein [Melioribacteraceae bacterium]
MRFIFRAILFTFFCSQLTPAQNGVIKSYYSDGTVQSETSYVNDVLDGAVITYLPDGKIFTEKNYSQGILDGFAREYYETGSLKEEYQVKKGILEGAYRKYNAGGELRELLSYSAGQLIKSEIFESSEIGIPVAAKMEETAIITAPVLTEAEKLKVIIPQKEKSIPKTEQAGRLKMEDEILCDVQECPVPIGGIKSIYDNLTYPEHALRYGLEGIVIIIATINAEGNVIRTQVLKGIGLGCDEAAQEALRKTRFTPGTLNGQPAETNATIKIAFQILRNDQ